MDLLFRTAILVLGYLYPAYKCYKTIDSSKIKYEHLHVWCQYWIIIAVFTGLERIADPFLSWLPFYSGFKLTFVVYLWHPDTKGTEHVYQTFLKPLVSKHMEAVDLNWVLLRNEAVEILSLLWDKLLSRVQLKLSGELHENVTQTPPVQILPPASSSFLWAKTPLGQHQQELLYSDHRVLVTQSAILPREQYQRQPLVASSSQQRPSLAQALKQAQPLNQISGHALSSETVQRAHQLAAGTQPAVRTSSGEIRNHGNKEESDFELVHRNEALSGVSDNNKGKQGTRSRWWWW